MPVCPRCQAPLGDRAVCAECGAPRPEGSPQPPGSDRLKTAAEIAMDRAVSIDSAPARASRGSSPLERAAGQALLLFLVAIGLLAGAGTIAIRFDHGAKWIAVGFLAFLAVGSLAGSAQIRAGDCPRCGKRFSSLFQSDRAYDCPHCREYLRNRDESLVPVEPGYVSAMPDFVARLATAAAGAAPPQWPWDGRCAVCGGPATRTEDFEVKRETMVGEVVAGRVKVAVETWHLAIAHCADHHGGVRIAYQGSYAPTQRVEFRFRAFDHWRAFADANRDRLAPDEES